MGNYCTLRRHVNGRNRKVQPPIVMHQIIWRMTSSDAVCMTDAMQSEQRTIGTVGYLQSYLLLAAEPHQFQGPPQSLAAGQIY